MATPAPTLVVTYNKASYTYGEQGFVVLSVEGADPETLTHSFSVEVDGTVLQGAGSTLLHHLVEKWKALGPAGYYTQDPAIPNRFTFTAKD